MGQNSGSRSKFNVFESTTFLYFCSGSRTPGTGGRPARRHTAVRAEDVATALNLATLLEEAADNTQQGQQLL